MTLAARSALALGAVTFGALALAAPAARAEFKMHYPEVEYREFELEHASTVTLDKSNSGLNNGQSYVNEIEYGILPWWKPGIEGEWAADPGGNLHYDATTFENYIVPFPQGKYWADVGFFAEYSHTAAKEDASDFNFGPMVQKEQTLGQLDLLHTANLFVTKEVGRNRSSVTPILIAWQTRARLDPMFEPGIEYYAQLNPVASPTSAGDPQHRLGPVVVGVYNMYALGKLKYELGYLFGLNNATEQGAVRWRLEYEKAF